MIELKDTVLLFIWLVTIIGFVYSVKTKVSVLENDDKRDRERIDKMEKDMDKTITEIKTEINRKASNSFAESIQQDMKELSAKFDKLQELIINRLK